MAVTDSSPPPSRWTLRTIRATFDIFSHLTLSGIWRALEHGTASGCGRGWCNTTAPIPNTYRNTKDFANA